MYILVYVCIMCGVYKSVLYTCTSMYCVCLGGMHEYVYAYVHVCMRVCVCVMYAWLRVTTITDSFVQSELGNGKFGLCLL